MITWPIDNLPVMAVINNNNIMGEKPSKELVKLFFVCV